MSAWLRFLTPVLVTTFLMGCGAATQILESRALGLVNNTIHKVFSQLQQGETPSPFKDCNTVKALLARLGQSTLPPGTSGSLNSCPWYYRMDNDSNRYPQNIAQAVLKSCFNQSRQYCVNLSSVMTENVRSNKFGYCKQVEQVLPVLRKMADGFALETEIVVTGYTCEYNRFEKLPVISRRKKRHGTLATLFDM